MKLYAFVISILLASSAAFADGNFDTHKQEEMKRIDDKVAALQAAKTCMSDAADHKAMKACHESLKKAMKKCNKKCHCEHGKNEDKKD